MFSLLLFFLPDPAPPGSTRSVKQPAPYGLKSRVLKGQPLFDAPRPAIHMVLQVNLPDGPYIADVGFGNLAPTCALRLELGTPHERIPDPRAAAR